MEINFKNGINANDCAEIFLKNKTVFYESRFNFLKEIGGLRKGCIHCLLGLSSSGKSTLLKSIIADTIKNAKCLIYLSEEESAFYAKGIIDAHNGPMGESKKNLIWFEESANEEAVEKASKDYRAATNFLIDVLIRSNCEVVFFDNLTTSDLYQSFGPMQQGFIVKSIRSFCAKANITFFFLAHTQKAVNSAINRLLTSEDVQGSSSVAKNSELFFVLQTFEIKNNRASFINITKSRQIEGGVKNKFFMLNFCLGKYVNDQISSFENLNDAFRSRNRLTETERRKYGKNN